MRRRPSGAVLGGSRRKRLPLADSRTSSRDGCFASVSWAGDLCVRAAVFVGRDGDRANERIIGPRFVRLMREIDVRGSIRQAALSLHLGYRHAVGWIQQAEALLGCPLVTRVAGGVAGGGASLANDGHRLIAAYQTMARDVEAVLRRAERRFIPRRPS